MNCQMIRSALKPRDLCDHKKQQHVDQWKRTRNPTVCIQLWFNRHVNMNICSKYVILEGNIQLWNKIRVELEHWSCLLNKSIVNVQTNNHWKYHIKVVNDYHKQIHDFVVIETHVIVLPFGAILTYVIIPNSPLPTKWSNQK